MKVDPKDNKVWQSRVLLTVLSNEISATELRAEDRQESMKHTA